MYLDIYCGSKQVTSLRQVNLPDVQSLLATPKSIFPPSQDDSILSCCLGTKGQILKSRCS